MKQEHKILYRNFLEDLRIGNNLGIQRLQHQRFQLPEHLLPQ